MSLELSKKSVPPVIFNPISDETRDNKKRKRDDSDVYRENKYRHSTQEHYCIGCGGPCKAFKTSFPDDKPW